MPRRRAPRDREDRLDEPEPTALPGERPTRRLEDEADEKLVPASNVGGAAPTPLGGDSGGGPPGSADDLANLAEPEPPQPPEVEAVHVRRDAGSARRGRRR